MNFEKELIHPEAIDFVISFEYTFTGDDLKLDKWKLYDDNDKEILVPDEYYSNEIEKYLAKWLEREYSRYSMNYISGYTEYLEEKRYCD